jgi:hypothetical protein
MELIFINNLNIRNKPWYIQANELGEALEHLANPVRDLLFTFTLGIGAHLAVMGLDHGSLPREVSS